MEILTESYPINTNHTNLLKKLSDALYSITDVNKFLDVINKLTLGTFALSTKGLGLGLATSCQITRKSLSDNFNRLYAVL